MNGRGSSMSVQRIGILEYERKEQTIQGSNQGVPGKRAQEDELFAKAYAKCILSARDNDGNRIETVEVSLKTYDVVQSRGVCNSATEWHNEIVNLVRSNMHLIRGVA